MSLSRLITFKSSKPKIVILELRPYIITFLQKYANLFDLLIISRNAHQITEALLTEANISGLVKGNICNYDKEISLASIK